MIKCLRTNNGSGFLSNDFDSLCKHCPIQRKICILHNRMKL